jgi:hypothetical protein
LELRAAPVSLVGPVLSLAFSWLAAICAEVDIGLSSFLD